jgi:hypothetical protein
MVAIAFFNYKFLVHQEFIPQVNFINQNFSSYVFQHLGAAVSHKLTTDNIPACPAQVVQ